MSWIHDTVTGQVALSDAIRNVALNGSITAVAVSAGGTGYTVGDILTISGGTVVGGLTGAAVVTSEAAGVVNGVAVESGGAYSSFPGSPASTTGGTGTGCTLTLTTDAANGWIEHLNENWDGIDGSAASNRKVILEGEGPGGTDAIFVGWRTGELSGAGSFFFELHGMTGYSGAFEFEEQAGISPGFADGISAEQPGAYVPVTDQSMEFWLSVNASRIIGIFRVGSNYWNMYLGFLNRYATSTEYPYPVYVGGCASNPQIVATTSQFHSGLSDPIRDQSNPWNTNGPGFMFFIDNDWKAVWHGDNGSRSPANNRVIFPVGVPNGPAAGTVPLIDKCFQDTFDYGDIFTRAGVPGNPTQQLKPTPGSPALRTLVPNILIFGDTFPSGQVIGELDGVRHCSGFGGVVSEDIFDDSGTRYRVFQNCTRSDDFAKIAVEEV